MAHELHAAHPCLQLHRHAPRRHVFDKPAREVARISMFLMIRHTFLCLLLQMYERFVMLTTAVLDPNVSGKTVV